MRSGAEAAVDGVRLQLLNKQSVGIQSFDVPLGSSYGGAGRAFATAEGVVAACARPSTPLSPESWRFLGSSMSCDGASGYSRSPSAWPPRLPGCSGARGSDAHPAKRLLSASVAP